MIAKYMKSYLKQAHNVMPVEGPHPYIIASIEKKTKKSRLLDPAQAYQSQSSSQELQTGCDRVQDQMIL